MNVYVDDDLKARMNAEEESVNWSKVASRAFENELKKIEKRKQKKRQEHRALQKMVSDGRKLLSMSQAFVNAFETMTKNEQEAALEKITKMHKEIKKSSAKD